MTVESTTTIDGLVADSPTSFDKKSEGDDHIRLLKAVLKASFPLFTGPLSIANDQIASKDYANSLAFSSALPGQDGNSGKFLTTDGSSASWGDVPLPVASTTVAGILFLAGTFDCLDGTDTTKAVTAEGLASAINARLGSANPLIEGTETPGISTKFSREDHVHPLGIPSGTVMLFCQESAPTGWTQVTNEKANNRMLRVVTGSGGGYAGTHNPTICNVVAAHTHSVQTGTESVTHQHSFTTGTESDAHSHNVNALMGSAQTGSGVATANTLGWEIGTSRITTQYESSNHHHSGWTDNASANHTHSGQTDTGSNATSWQPKYTNIILCQKN